MLLRNFDFAVKYFDYKSKTELEETSNPKTYGWYKFIDGLLSALLVTDNNLYFLYGEDKILIKESYRVLLKEKSNKESEFSLVNGKNVLVKFLYHLPDPKLNVAPFEYIDEDDFKWGEFIAKIINDKERQRNFVMNFGSVSK
jgi:predicted PolB exonuclease-like 3'-5' exonuclease